MESAGIEEVSRAPLVHLVVVLWPECFGKPCDVIDDRGVPNGSR
jgi:hypothetical protein